MVEDPPRRTQDIQGRFLETVEHDKGEERSPTHSPVTLELALPTRIAVNGLSRPLRGGATIGG